VITFTKKKRQGTQSSRGKKRWDPPRRRRQWRAPPPHVPMVCRGEIISTVLLDLCRVFYLPSILSRFYQVWLFALCFHVPLPSSAVFPCVSGSELGKEARLPSSENFILAKRAPLNNNRFSGSCHTLIEKKYFNANNTLVNYRKVDNIDTSRTFKYHEMKNSNVTRSWRKREIGRWILLIVF
jgi:hypothetical protein